MLNKHFTYRNLKRFKPAFIAFGIVFSMAVISSAFERKLIIYNATNSLPVGLYYVVKKTHYQSGDIVCFPIPEHVKRMVSERKWLPENSYLLKKIIAVYGDYCCIDNYKYHVKNSYGNIKLTDSSGRTMPEISLCKLLSINEFFVGDLDQERSFDSRYFGTININNIHGIARPLWIF